MNSKLIFYWSIIYSWIMLRAYSRPERILRSFFKWLPFVDEKLFLLSNIRREVEQRKLQYQPKSIGVSPCRESQRKREFDLPPVTPSQKKPFPKIIDKLQFVFISIDIENIRGTIEAIDKYINFVDSYLIVTSQEKVALFQAIESKYKVIVIDENDILDEDIVMFKSRDHQTKNWMLRASLLKIDILQNIFIMLDDDSRPLQNITIDHFIDGGRYQGYYYYDLDKWHHHTSDYDFGQHNTRELLEAEGFEHLSYSSHKPQIIDKAIFQEVVDRYFAIGVSMPIDEWSVYFNYAIANYPKIFYKRKFDVLNWPDHPSRWEWLYKPDEYNFENYYDSVYQDGLFGYQKNLTTSKKIELKNQELEPYIKTQELQKEWHRYFNVNKFVHKELQFQHKESLFVCYGLPYYQEVTQGTWLKIPLKYKAFSLKNQRVQLMYYLNGDLWHSSLVYTGDVKTSDCFEGIFYFDIDCQTLKSGFYRLLIDVAMDSHSLFQENSPYLMGLRVV